MSVIRKRYILILGTGQTKGLDYSITEQHQRLNILLTLLSLKKVFSSLY